MQAVDILNRMQQALGVKTRRALAKFLGISPSNINQAIGKNRVPELWLYKVGEETRTPVAYFTEIHPEGAEKHGVHEPAPVYIRNTLNDLIERLDEEERQAVDRLVRALKGGDAQVRRHLIVQLQIIIDALHARRARTRQTQEEGGGG